MSNEDTDTTDWQDAAIDAVEGAGDIAPSNEPALDVESSVETTPSTEGSEGSAESTGMGSNVKIDTKEYTQVDADMESKRDNPSLAEVENQSKKQEESTGDVQRKDSLNKAATKDVITSRSNKFLELKQKRRAAAMVARSAGSSGNEVEEKLASGYDTPFEEKDADVVQNKAQEVVSKVETNVHVTNTFDIDKTENPSSLEKDSKQLEEKTQLDSTEEDVSKDAVDVKVLAEKGTKEPDGEESKDVAAKYGGATHFKNSEEDKDNITSFWTHLEPRNPVVLSCSNPDGMIAPLLVEEVSPVQTHNTNTPRSQNHRMKHVKNLRQNYQSPTKTQVETHDSLVVESVPSIATSSSQVTAKRHNGEHKTTIPATSSNMSIVSDASSFGIDDIDSTLSSENFMKEKDRLRLRKIALQAIAVPFSNDHLATLKEAKSSGSGSINPCDNDRFDPFASSASEVQLQNTGKIEYCVVDSTPSQAPIRHADIIKSASTSSSNSSAPTQTFQKLAPVRAENGFVDIGRLIIVGVAGLVGGVMLSVFSLNTCEFVTIRKQVGYYNENLIVHAGMSSFTSMDSVFLGGTECMSYDDEYYGAEPPVFAKATAMLALIIGVLSTTVVWVYIFTNRTTVEAWTAATVFASTASVLQLLTFQFFFSTVCNEQDCGVGMGSLASFIAVCTYGYMAFEMNRNCPVRRIIIPGMVNNLIESGELYVKGMSDIIAKKRDPLYSAPELV